MRNDFDLVAPFYDLLARIVFGTKISQAASCYLHHIRKHDHVLIVGGGTGRILDHLPKAIKITYLELSKDMLEKARKRDRKDIQFENADFLKSEFREEQFDVILLPFFLDVFSRSNLDRVLIKTSYFLKDDGRLLVADFQRTGKWHHVVLLWVMHRFFGVLSGLESRSLQDIRGRLAAKGFVEEEITFFSQELIFSGCYHKQLQD